jgi:hypothetical protein
LRHLAAGAAALFLLAGAALSACHGGADEKSKCLIAEEGKLVTCLDPKAAGLCTNLRTSPIPCRGKQGCRPAGDREVSCDPSVGRVGDPCFVEPVFGSSTPGEVCSEDGKSKLVCHEGKVALVELCRGAKACSTAPGAYSGASCDRTRAEVGDACNHGSHKEGMGTCSVDGKSLLQCDRDEDGKFAVSRVCSGPKGCTTVDSYPACDVSTASTGAVCGKDDQSRLTCGVDGTVIRCTDGTWKKERDCAKGTRCVANRQAFTPEQLCEKSGAQTR